MCTDVSGAIMATCARWSNLKKKYTDTSSTGSNKNKRVILASIP